MAAPTFVGASTGVVVTGASGTVAADIAGLAIGDLVLIHILTDGSPQGSAGSPSGIVGLDGGAVLFNLTPNASVGSPVVALHGIWVGRVSSLTAPSILATAPGAGHDLYCRIYAFRGVNTGATMLSVMENGGTDGTNIGSGAARESAGLSTAISDQQVVTSAADRLALQVVAVDDDNPVGPFTGMTGGTWAEAVAEFASATGTDGCIQLQTATIASAGTINGGSYTMAASDSWGVVGFALIPVAAAVDPMPFILMGRYTP